MVCPEYKNHILLEDHVESILSLQVRYNLPVSRLEMALCRCADIYCYYLLE